LKKGSLIIRPVRRDRSASGVRLETTGISLDDRDALIAQVRNAVADLLQKDAA